MALILAKCDKCGTVSEKVSEVGYDGEHKCPPCHIEDELKNARSRYKDKRKWVHEVYGKWVHEVYGKQLREMRAEIAALTRRSK